MADAFPIYFGNTHADLTKKTNKIQRGGHIAHIMFAGKYF